MSLVTRLLLLIGLAMIPVFAAQVFTQFELRQERNAALQADAVRYTRLVSSDADRVLEGAKSILIAVSETPFIQSLNRADCSAYLTALSKRYSQILNITVIDTDGTPLCANTPIAPNATATGRFYFEEALRQNRFAVGNHIVGRTIPKPQLPVALPYQDATGRTRVVSIGFDLNWLEEHFRALALPPGAALWMADRNGIVVTAPSDPGAVGHPLPLALRPARDQSEGTFERQDSNGTIHIVGFEPLSASPVGLTIAVDLPQQDLSAMVEKASERDLAILLVSMLSAAALAAFGATRLVSRPLRTLTAAAKAWTTGHHNVRTCLADHRSEIGQLGIAFDRMADTVQANQQALQAINETLEQRVADRTAALLATNQQLETAMAERDAMEEALRQAQKMEAIGRLTGGIAHDFNNLLTAIGGSIELMVKTTANPGERTLRYANLGRDAVRRAVRLTHRLLVFARQQPLQLQTLDLNQMITGMAELLTRTLGENVAVTTDLAANLWPVRSDPVQLENALLNLAVNARDAMPTGGRLTIETANTVLDQAFAAAHADVEAGDYVMLAVTDTGTGMSPDIISRAFDPFFTTKPVEKGTGLGLSMIYGFARQSGGHVGIHSELGRGTTFKLYLPRVRMTLDPDPAPLPDTAPVSARTGETILVIEDDDTVRALSIEFLRDLGYAVLVAPDAARGLDLLRHHAEVTLLFTDVVLAGGMDGRQLAEQALREHPGLRILFTTGYAPEGIFQGGMLDPTIHLLPKPFTIETLGAKLRAVLDNTTPA